MACNDKCENYRALKPIGKKSRYGTGQKRCQVCEIYINWDGNHCPCCNYLLRTKPRRTKYKFKLKGIKIDPTTKTKYVGSGKDPKLALFIDEEYFKSVPRLADSQYEMLLEDIQTNGQHEPIIVNPNGKILDGHTRYQILSSLGKSVNYVVKNFKTELEERTYVVTANLKRRQLTTFQIFELSETVRNMMISKRKSEQSMKMWATRKGVKEPEPRDNGEKYRQSTDYQFSKLIGLGAGQIEACVYVKAHAKPELLEKIRKGQISVNSAKLLLIRRDNPSYEPHPERKIDQVPKCMKCSAPCRRTRLCHVHDNWCCTQCEYGF